jgi:threonine/homoserine/homoserine lactone efflux protein
VTLAAAPLLAAAGVALGHAVLPDHWVPLAVIGRTRRYPLTRIARLSSLAGIAHVLVSLILGAVIIVIGLQFRSRIEDAQDTIVGLLLIGTGVAFAVVELAGRGHRHPRGQEHSPGQERGHGQEDGRGHPHSHEHAQHCFRFHALAGIAVPFGAAASPDLTILPVFLAATTAGTEAAVGSLVVFAVVTIATIVGLTVAAAAGSYQLRVPWLERWGNAFTAAVLIALGALVVAGVL